MTGSRSDPARRHPRHPSRHRLAATALGLLLTLSACSTGGADTTTSDRTSTVTVTSSTGPSATASATPTATSDVRGRGFDVGTVQGTRTVAGVLTVELDRWTVRGLSDTRLARVGVPVEPHDDERYLNQNSDRTYTVPVAPGASTVINRCIRTGELLGLRSTPEDAEDWLADASPDVVLVVTYDSQGRATRFDTDPRCLAPAPSRSPTSSATTSTTGSSS